jgi:hypothetical protein
MPKKILIITAIIVAVIGLGATAVYVTQKQGGKEVKKQEEVTTTTERQVIQPGKPIVQSQEQTVSELLITSGWKVYVNDDRIFIRNRSLGIKKEILSINQLPKKVLGLSVENKYFCDAVLSSDGTKIAFSVIGPPRGGLPPETEGKTTAHEWIGILNLKTGDIKAIYVGIGCGKLKWSPNEKYIVVEGLGEYTGLPYFSIIDAEKSVVIGPIPIPKPKELSWEEELAFYGAKFSQDSKTIYFYTLPTDDYFDLMRHCVSRQSVGDLWKYDIEKGKVERIRQGE